MSAGDFSRTRDCHGLLDRSTAACRTIPRLHACPGTLCCGHGPRLPQAFPDAVELNGRRSRCLSRRDAS